MQTINFIMNMNDLFKPALKQEQQPFYQEWLCKFTDNQLDELWESTMENHVRTSPPTIGELKKYAKEVTPVKIVNQDFAKQEGKRLSEMEIFSTQLGREALRQGWAHSYLIYCRENGIPDNQGYETHLMFQKWKQEADEAYIACKDMENVGGVLNIASALINMRNTHCRANEEFARKYNYLIAGTHLEEI